ncbi:Argininosuccinate synthase [uncultured archaeon]|nr:Argininosuccinate synthase [uncultured archaeon]
MDQFASRLKASAGAEYQNIESAVLLYSGGLESRVVGSVLQEWGLEVYPLVLDMGGREKRMAAVEKEAKVRFGRADMRSIVPDILSAARRGIKTNCLSYGYLNAGGFSRPFMAQAAAKFAAEKNISVVIHGHSGLSDDHLRFELSMRALAPQIRTLCPVRDWDMKREESRDYDKRQKGTQSFSAPSFSIDENIWGRTAWQGDLLDPQARLPQTIGEWGGEKKRGGNESAKLTVAFANGTAENVQVTNRTKKETITGDEIVPYLNSLGASFGIGGRDIVVDKMMGPKTREYHQGPAAEILVAAHADLESICLTKKEQEMKSGIDRAWNKLVDEGGWFTRLRHQLDAFVDETQNVVDGEVNLTLETGRLLVAGRSSPHALYDARLGRSDSAGLLSSSSSRAYARLRDLQETLAYRSGMEK